MNLDEVAERVANSIREDEKIRVRGYVAFAVKNHAQEIRRILDETYFKIPDLFRSVSLKLGEEPCNHRNFRSLCDKYCSGGEESKNLDSSPNERLGEKEVSTFISGEGARERELNASVSNESDVEELGKEWGEILESLGPAKKTQLPLAIKGGLTLDEAKDARETSTKRLKDVMTTYARRRR